MKTVKIMLASLRRLFDWLAVITNVSASLMIFAMMFLITLDIALRYLFNSPIRGVTQIVEIAIVVIVYLQLTHALKMGRITRSDALYSAIMKRHPAIGNVIGIVFNAAGAGLMIAIIIGGWPKWIDAYKQGHFIGSVGVFTFPEWPQLLIVLIGCAMMAIQFALFVFDHIGGLLQMRPVEDGKSA
jgi:TRAP-type mannitol/chloroaromatic compound transport system permease small subunit